MFRDGNTKLEGERKKERSKAKSIPTIKVDKNEGRERGKKVMRHTQGMQERNTQESKCDCPVIVFWLLLLLAC